jgi:hypothetical protein
MATRVLKVLALAITFKLVVLYARNVESDPGSIFMSNIVLI